MCYTSLTHVGCISQTTLIELLYIYIHINTINTHTPSLLSSSSFSSPSKYFPLLFVCYIPFLISMHSSSQFLPLHHFSLLPSISPSFSYPIYTLSTLTLFPSILPSPSSLHSHTQRENILNHIPFSLLSLFIFIFLFFFFFFYSLLSSPLSLNHPFNLFLPSPPLKTPDQETLCFTLSHQFLLLLILILILILLHIHSIYLEMMSSPASFMYSFLVSILSISLSLHLLFLLLLPSSSSSSSSSSSLFSLLSSLPSHLSFFLSHPF